MPMPAKPAIGAADHAFAGHLGGEGVLTQTFCGGDDSGFDAG